MDKQEITALIQQLSIEAGSQTQLAQDLGTSIQTVNNWYNGRTKPSEKSIERIRKILNPTNKSPCWSCNNRTTCTGICHKYKNFLRSKVIDS